MINFRLACLAVIAMVANDAFAQSNSWSEKQICSAAIYTYFFLDGAPSDLGFDDGFTMWESARGNVYGCKLDESEKVFLRWINKDRIMLTSRKVEYVDDGDVLSVKTELAEKRFQQSGAEWRVLN